MKSKKLNTRTMDDMTQYEVSRWLALLDAVNIVADNAEKNGMHFSEMQIKQTAIETYVDSTCTTILKAITGKKVV